MPPPVDLAAVRALVSRIPGDDEDLWSCSRAFRLELADWFALLGPSLSVVEIGSYRGQTTAVLSRVFKTVLALDINATLLSVAAARLRWSGGVRRSVDFVRADSAREPWWEAPLARNAAVLVVDAGHSYEAVRGDLDVGLRHLPELRWVVVDDYGSLPPVARAIEESLSRGDFAHCKPLGRRSGERIRLAPEAGYEYLRYLGPEAVLCSVHVRGRGGHGVSSTSLIAATSRGGRRLRLQDRLYEICLGACAEFEHMLTQPGGFVNFSDSGSGIGPSNGSLTFSHFDGGGRGRWYQPIAGLLAKANFHGRTYYFSFLPNLIAFQANEEAAPPKRGKPLEPGAVVFRATRVSPVAPEWFGPESPSHFRLSAH